MWKRRSYTSKYVKLLTIICYLVFTLGTILQKLIKKTEFNFIKKVKQVYGIIKCEVRIFQFYRNLKDKNKLAKINNA